MTPPRLARWLLKAATPRDKRADLIAELDDEFRTRPAADARRWYWHEVKQSLLPLIAERARAAAAGPRGIGQDLRFAFRSLRAVPAFTAGVIVMLAVGIGAHLVVYAVVDGLLLRPMPFGDRSSRLVTIHSLHPTVAPDWDDARVSYPDLVDLRKRAVGMEAIEGVIGRNVSLSSGSDTVRVPAASVTTGLFDVLGVRPALGRSFVASDAAAIGQESSVIISASLWKSLFGADAGVIGRTALMNGRPLRIIGVMTDGFTFPSDQQLWLPYRGDEADGRASRGMLAVGLLRRGVSIGEGRAELNTAAAALAREFPATNRGWSVHAMPIRDFFVSGRHQTTLFGAVTFVLFAVCANVAGLIVARGVGRQRELTLRAALGAARGRLVRLLVVETMVLAGVGGGLGLLAASWGVRALVAWSPEPPPYWAQPEIDWRVALVAVVLTFAVALLSGLLPALRISRVDASGALLPGARPNSGAPQHRRLQHLLVSAQVALSFALLVGAGLLNRSATQLLHADGGFDPAPLVSARFYIAGDRYDDPSVRGAVVDQVVARIAALPGVAGAASTGSIPTDDGGAANRVKDPSAPGDPAREVGVQLTPAAPSLWDALHLRLQSGRTFTAAESASAGSDVAIINAALAARLWPRDSPLDRTIDVVEPQPRDGHPSGSIVTLRIVGVAPNLVYEEFGEETPQSQLMIYVPTARAAWRTQALLVRTSGDPSVLAAAIRAEVRRVDPGFAVYDVMTMADRRAYNHWGERFIGRTASAFAIVALMLAAIGAYAIAAYTVTQRTREIGVRLALGSTRARVMRGFLWLGGRLALAGGAAGALIGLGVARLLQDELFRVSPWTAGEWVVPAALLAAAVIAATYLPARRASRIEPADALRND
jgi:predicted permease